MTSTIKALAAALVGAACIAAYAQQNARLDAPFDASAAGEQHRHHHHCGSPTPADIDGAAHAWHRCGGHRKPMANGPQEGAGPSPGV